MFLRKITADDEFSLYSVTIFKRVHDDFAQKLRENK
jgi:V-type H+-transporting ATPase subunit C